MKRLLSGPPACSNFMSRSRRLVVKFGIVFLSLLELLPGAAAADAKSPVGPIFARSEIVMAPGMRITARTPAGTVGIIAIDELTRSYTWDRATHAVEMTPRATTTGRVRGSLGIFNDVEEFHWCDHNGIRRGLMEEGQQDFETVDEALRWVKRRGWLPSVYRNDGLMVGWDKNLETDRLTVEVWQILIRGKKPTKLPGSQDDKIVVETVKAESVRANGAIATRDRKPRSSVLPPESGVVMSPGMRITATTPVGTIAITAVDELTRSFTWDGATRAVEMEPRTTPTGHWEANSGIRSAGLGEHWRDQHGIRRCDTVESQVHFKAVEDAMNWIKEEECMPFVYRDDGLVVGWDKDLATRRLGVLVWQILIDGKKPEGLAGSQNDKIVVETVETETSVLVKAVANNDLKAATALFASGADPNMRNSIEVPILLIAVRNGSAPLVEVLLKNGANPNVRDVDTDTTPLLEAFDRLDIVKALLAAGADVNAASRNTGNFDSGMTPLMVAAGEGFEDIVRLLLDNGANVNARTPNGETALSLARQDHAEEQRGVIRILEAAGAKK
jgi:hypothetical protein